MSEFLADSPYEAVIGLEVHAQLKTRTKIFCGCQASFGSAPNSQTCPVCLGMPGVLPVLNRQVVEYALRMALATHSAIAPTSIFARKNYFYPDLPKAYQISQFEEPLCEHGYVEFEDDDTWKRVALTRIHLEEDAGKLLHPGNGSGGGSRVDLNRCGTPLIEIVSEPEIKTPHDAALYMMEVRRTLRYLDICDGNMEEGSLRCDANISIRKKGETHLGTKTELKNMNSFRNVERALEYEVFRQIDMLETGEPIIQQTLTWDARTNIASPMRDKEDSHDYRYFPDPDLVPVKIDEDWLESLRSAMPELPREKKQRFVEQYDIRSYDAGILTDSQELAHYFEDVVKTGVDAQKAGNWIITEVLGRLNERNQDIADFSVSAEQLGALLGRIADSTISGKIAKDVFEEMIDTGQTVDTIIDARGLEQISDDAALREIITGVLSEHPDDAQAYRDGNKKVAGFFVGQIMRATQGKANPQVVNTLLREMLDAG